MKLTNDFYRRDNVVQIAKELLGKVLFTRVNLVLTAGIIVETEAYSWKERGCHAYNNKRTKRNEIMFAAGGFAYVYLCYGMHYLFNVVTNVEEAPEAVLIRAIEPAVGLEQMQERRGLLKNPYLLTSGPGKLTKALAIDRSMNAKSLLADEVWIEEGKIIRNKDLVVSKRIGIDYAGSDADLPWRFTVKGNRWVSK